VSVVLDVIVFSLALQLLELDVHVVPIVTVSVFPSALSAIVESLKVMIAVAHPVLPRLTVPMFTPVIESVSFEAPLSVMTTDAAVDVPFHPAFIELALIASENV